MTWNFRFSWVLAAILSAVLRAQTILPQIADGGNWRTQVVLVNTTTNAATVSMNFYQDTTAGATVPWNPPFQGRSSTQNIAVPAAGTIFLLTPGMAGTLTQGWGQLVAPPSLVPSVSAYAIYTYGSFNGRPAQDGTSEAVGAVSRVLVPFDNSAGGGWVVPAYFATSMAIVNPNNSAETVSVNIQTDTGTISTATLPSLPANGQMAFLTSQQFPATAGQRGLLEFYVANGGTIAISSFRFNPTLALTSSPTFPVNGPAIIGVAAPPSAGPGFSNFYLPQIADGGNWRTQVVLVNTSSSAGVASLSFFEDIIGDANGATQAWNPPFVELSSTQNIAVPGGGTVFLHTPGASAALSQGWAQVTGTIGITAYAVYTYESYNGRPEQDGTFKAVSSVAGLGGAGALVPFDNTDGAVTSVAIANTIGLGAVPITVNIQTEDGTISHASLPTLNGGGQMAFVTAQQIPAMAGKRGLAELFPSIPRIATASFRFNPTLGFTSSPVLVGNGGAPIIGSTAPHQASILSLAGGLTLQAPDSGFAIALWVLQATDSITPRFAAFGTNVPSFVNCTSSNGNLNYTCASLNTAVVGGNRLQLQSGQTFLASSATLTFTLAPSGLIYSGTVNGTLTLMGSYSTSPGTIQTLTGSIVGSYSVVP